MPPYRDGWRCPKCCPLRGTPRHGFRATLHMAREGNWYEYTCLNCGHVQKDKEEKADGRANRS